MRWLLLWETGTACFSRLLRVKYGGRREAAQQLWQTQPQNHRRGVAGSVRFSIERSVISDRYSATSEVPPESRLKDITLDSNLISGIG